MHSDNAQKAPTQFVSTFVDTVLSTVCVQRVSHFGVMPIKMPALIVKSISTFYILFAHPLNFCSIYSVGISARLICCIVSACHFVKHCGVLSDFAQSKVIQSTCSPCWKLISGILL